MDIKLFDKCKCKGFYKPFRDGKWLSLNKETLTADACDSNLLNDGNDGIAEKDVEYIEKTYFKHIEKEFVGVVVGYKDLVITGYLDVVYQEECDVGIGIIPEKFCVNKRPKDVIKCAIVYYANNKKHYVPVEDMEVL